MLLGDDNYGLDAYGMARCITRAKPVSRARISLECFQEKPRTVSE